MKHLRLDFETYGEVELKKVGADFYARHPLTEALMLSWKLDNLDIRLWDIKSGEPMPKLLNDALKDTTVLVHAFNARFEYLILRFVLKIHIPIHRFRCTQVLSFAMGFKGELDAVLKDVGFPAKYRKNKEGKDLIGRFSKPQPQNQKVRRWGPDNDPEGWENFKAYCIQDTLVEEALETWLVQFNPMSPQEWELWFLDQDINDRGAPIDVELCTKADEMYRALRSRVKEVLWERTGLENALSNQQMRKWLGQAGCRLPNMQEETLERTIPDMPDHIRPVAESYFAATRTAATKWAAFLRCACEDGRVRGMFQFGGASRTRRWAGRLVQLHNLRHGPPEESCADAIMVGHASLFEAMYPNALDTLASTIRAAITASPGHALVSADLTSIESVVLGHLAGCPALERIYREGKDAYRIFAMNYFQITYNAVTKDQRNFSKPPVLGCGFQLGWKGLIEYARGYGVKLREEEARIAVDLFRTSYPEIVDMWYGLLEGIEAILASPEGTVYQRFKVRIYRDIYFLYIELPSGRRLAYYKPEWRDWDTPIGRRPSFTYMGIDRVTTQWRRIAAHGGLITENIVQATARDILAEGMRRYAAGGGRIVAHVHDEIIAEEPESVAEQRLEQLKAAMTTQPEWLPDIWLGAGGWVGKRYRKD